MTALVPWRMKDRYPDLFKDNTWNVESIFENLWSNFNDFFGDTRYVNNDGDVVYEIEVPGFNKDNLKVEIADGILTIRGERKIESDRHAGEKSIFKRMSIGSITDVDAKIEDGILYLTVKSPKKDVKSVEVK